MTHSMEYSHFHNQRILLKDVARAARQAGYHSAAEIMDILLDPSRAVSLTDDLHEVLRHIELGDHGRAKRLLENQTMNKFDRLKEAVATQLGAVSPTPANDSIEPDSVAQEARISGLRQVVHLLFPVKTASNGDARA